jgi:hypothetical protein
MESLLDQPTVHRDHEPTSRPLGPNPNPNRNPFGLGVRIKIRSLQFMEGILLVNEWPTLHKHLVLHWEIRVHPRRDASAPWIDFMEGLKRGGAAHWESEPGPTPRWIER